MAINSHTVACNSCNTFKLTFRKIPCNYKTMESLTSFVYTIKLPSNAISTDNSHTVAWDDATYVNWSLEKVSFNNISNWIVYCLFSHNGIAKQFCMPIIAWIAWPNNAILAINCHPVACKSGNACKLTFRKNYLLQRQLLTIWTILKMKGFQTFSRSTCSIDLFTI